MGSFTQKLLKPSTAAPAKTSSVVFDRSAGKATRAFLIRGNERQITPELGQIFADFPASISDRLMYHDGVCFSIYGENLTIPILLKVYGVAGLMDLLDQGAIKYFLESSIITYMESDNPGVHPLQSGRLTNSVHKDPDASVGVALQGLIRPPDGSTLRRLSRRLADAYVTPSADFAPTVVRLAHDGYEKGQFASLGLFPEVEFSRMNLKGRQSLGKIAQQLLDLTTMSDLCLESVDEFEIMQVCADSFRNLVGAQRVADAAVKLFEIENVPRLSECFKRGLLETKDLPRLRQNPHAVRFRRWLRETTENTDTADIGREYIDAVSGRHNFFETTKGKIVKTVSVSGLSAAAGTLIMGPVGTVIGAAAGAVVAPAVDAGLSLLDEFILDGILKGWQPRNYFDKVLRPELELGSTKK